jgi:Rrf2 family transcriptional regulator, nitric oxide-sensitive transcriptional repressor
MISQTAEYALRAVVLLAHEHGKPCTAQQLADRSNIPFMYLSKIMASLTRGGIVRSQRGPGGGFVLIRPANEITMIDVITVVEPLKHFCECPLAGGGCEQPGPELCPLHRRLQAVGDLLEQAFLETSIEDLLAEGAGSVTMCEAEGRNTKK